LVEDRGHLTQVAYTLVDLISTSGTNIAPQVVVTLQHKGKKQTKESTGDGPVDACYKAIESIAQLKVNLLDYSIKSVTQGKDALGEVTVKRPLNGQTVIGRAASTDIIEASAKAYINAINKFVPHQKKLKQ
jgi:2-isopropylmalate synthase